MTKPQRDAKGRFVKRQGMTPEQYRSAMASLHETALALTAIMKARLFPEPWWKRLFWSLRNTLDRRGE